MMNPPMDQSMPYAAEAMPQKKMPDFVPDFTPDESEQQAIVNLCNQFKQSAQQFAREKKERLRLAYGYTRNNFADGDLLPIMTNKGNERDAQKGRPQVFIPLTRQQLKMLLSQMKGNFFPNDQDYFRVRAKTALGAPYEDELTEGLKYVFRDAMISEKLGGIIYNALWSGMFCALPIIKDEKTHEWTFQEGQRDFQGQVLIPDGFIQESVEVAGKLDIDAFNPLNLYVDPMTSDVEKMKWVYTSNKKYQDFMDGTQYINKDKLKDVAKKSVSRDPAKQGMMRADITFTQSSFQDIEDSIEYDQYYFPCLTTENNEYRNFVVGIAGSQVLTRFNPNTYPRGMNPLVYCSWYLDSEDPYSYGPAEELIELQKLINILWNYKIEVMARSGNRFVVKPNVNLSNFWGVAGGVAVSENPRDDIVNFSGNISELGSIDNSVGVLKAEAQLMSGAQQPFQGSANIDYKKTATELQIVQENAINIVKDAIEHIGVMGIQRVLERLMLLVADAYKEPLEVPITDPMTKQTVYQKIDFSVLKSGLFTIELIGINPSQSKQAQINGLMQLINMVGSNPETLLVVEPVIQKIGDLLGVKDIRELIEEIKQRLMSGLQQSGNIPPGVGTPPQPPMG